MFYDVQYNQHEVYFSFKNSTSVSIGLAPLIRITIAVKRWIRIPASALKAMGIRTDFIVVLSYSISTSASEACGIVLYYRLEKAF
jgi:hypothetical protein